MHNAGRLLLLLLAFAGIGALLFTGRSVPRSDPAGSPGRPAPASLPPPEDPVEAARAAGDFRRAAALQRERVAADPGDAPARERLADLLLEHASFFPAGEPERDRLLAEAAVELEGTVAVQPDHVGGWIRLGLVRSHQGDAEAARAAWERARDLNPYDPVTHLIFGIEILPGWKDLDARNEARLESGEELVLLEFQMHAESTVDPEGTLAEADLHFARAIEADPTFAPARRGRAEVAWLRGRAFERWHEGMTIVDRQLRSGDRGILSRAVRREAVETAIAEYEKLLGWEPYAPGVHASLARLYRWLHPTSPKVESAFEQAIRIDPADETLLREYYIYLQGRAFHHLVRREKQAARRYFDRCSRFLPPEVSQEPFDVIESFLEESLERERMAAEALDRADRLAERGYWEEALGAYREAALWDPQGFRPRLMIARLFARLDRPEEAIAAFRELIDDAPERPEPFLYKGDLDRSRGDEELATIDYEGALNRARDLRLREPDVARAVAQGVLERVPENSDLARRSRDLLAALGD